MSSTTSIVIVNSFTIVLMSLLAGAVGLGTFAVGDTISQPDVYSMVTYIGEGFWDLMAFEVTGMPEVISVAFWILVLWTCWSILSLIRGTS